MRNLSGTCSLVVVVCNKWANNCSANEPIMFSNCIIYSFQPFTVGGLSPGGTVTMDRNNVKFWMEIKSGRYPDVSLSKPLLSKPISNFFPLKIRPVTGVTQIGEDLSVMIYVKDRIRDRRPADVMTRDCWAYDSGDFQALTTHKLQLTSEAGCSL